MKANIKFVLNPTSKGQERPIILKCNSSAFKNNYFMYSTGEYVNKSLWSDSKGGYVKGVTKKAEEINDKLSEYKKAFENDFKKGVIDKNELKVILNKIKIPGYEDPQEIKKEKKFKTVVAYAKYILDNDQVYYSESDKAMKKMVPGTIKSKKQAIERLKDFEGKYKYRVTFENCSATFWKQFFEFLTKRGLSQGTRGKIVKDIRSFLNKATQNGYEVCQDYKIKGVAPVEKSERKLIYLNQTEIEQIAKLNLSNRPAIENSRDWLLVAVGTGLRHSDLIRLSQNNIIENEYGKSIRIQTQKTDTLVEIPFIFDWFENMMIRRNWKFPKRISSQKLNKNFKEIGRLAELSRKVTARIYDEKKKLWILKDVPIYEALSSHVGRRSFTSNLVKQKLPLTLIAKMTGHSKLETLQIYEQLNEHETAETVVHMIRNSKMYVS